MSISSNDNLQSQNGITYSGIKELWAIEAALTKYNENLVRLLSSFFSKKDRILEFGAGIGTLASLWNKGVGIQPECIEIDPVLQNVLKKRGFICYGGTNEVVGKYDGIYTSNVLEHIDDDISTLISLHDKLKPGSCIAVYVPAFKCLYSDMDLAVGHIRRYSKQELCLKLMATGFDIKHKSYSDSIGFFVWIIFKFRGSVMANSLQNIELLAKYDHFIFPISNFLDSLGLKYLLGKNLLVVGQKRKSS